MRRLPEGGFRVSMILVSLIDLNKGCPTHYSKGPTGWAF